ncbi:sigma-54-dependent Fis family transcriptional regulator [Paraburkholderia sp. J67]|uniref:sigma-54-dependent Fis family transcriptional regulator n=1 Tax=Paraburkholderia sp. J67 TaxID=2805435 RepID=UPI002ABE9D96|nr:sigma-54-dependent Fis family transcriptional regulator [Paraburkholderia sp. J67]
MQLDVLGTEVFSPDFSRRVMSAWENFMVEGSGAEQVHDAKVRDVILSSWQRCREGQVPPAVEEAPLAARGDDLQQLHMEHQDLLDVTREVVASLGGVLNQSRSVLVVTDPQGVILNAYGDPATVDSGAERHIAPGGHWGELVSGTNAIGTAIAAGSPVQVHALEHYCEGVKAWTCSAALVRDGRGGDILGAIDISGSDDTFNFHSLGLAISIATQIESILKGKEARDTIKLLEWCSAESSTWHGDGVIVLDAKGRVISANQHASDALTRLGLPQPVVHGQPLPGTLRSACRRPVDLPLWVKPEWVQPVRFDGRSFGSLVVIPRSTLRSSQTALARPAVVNEASPGTGFENIVGLSDAIGAAVSRARRLAAGTLPVLLLGETGVGKEEFAKAIHECSPVHAGPFVAVNCGAFARELIASELFGYAEGAFTGAVKGGRRGKFEEADGGTLFLDEIGELPLDVQPHLLRVLQDGIVTRIGESRARKVTVRIISATNRNLRAVIGEGRFREDLYYRLAVATLSLPPLRSRQRDVPLLAEHFVERFAQRTGTPAKLISAELRQALSLHAWPGNIRELKNTLESMCQIADGDTLMLDDLPLECRSEDVQPEGPKLAGLKARERESIIAAIDAHGGNLRQAAQSLGIARSTLYVKIRAYGIRRSFVTDDDSKPLS